MNVMIQNELLSAVEELSPLEIGLVITFAKALQATPVSQVGQAYLEILIQQGATPAELLHAAQAVQRVELRLAQQSPQETLYDLNLRTEKQVETWFREQGLDYQTMAEEQFDEIVAGIINQRRKAK